MSPQTFIFLGLSGSGKGTQFFIEHLTPDTQVGEDIVRHDYDK
jgi:putative ribosome biogenesis GTPase RsgA